MFLNLERCVKEKKFSAQESCAKSETQLRILITAHILHKFRKNVNSFKQEP